MTKSPASDGVWFEVGVNITTSWLKPNGNDKFETQHDPLPR